MSQYRLPTDLQADLEWYWCQAEADVGVCSTGDIEHRGPAQLESVQKELGMHLKRKDRRRRKHEKADEELRLMWQTITCKGDSHANSVDDPVSGVMSSHGVPFIMDRTPMPAWARRIVSKDRDRMRRIHGSVSRLVAGHLGPQHERVLYRTYGPVHRHPVCYGEVGNELAPLVEYTDVVVARMAPGTPASETGEAILRKGVSAKVVRAIRDQANEMLVAASRAYADCDEAVKSERLRDRRAKFAAILGAA